jgi:hypothetical protein
MASGQGAVEHSAQLARVRPRIYPLIHELGTPCLKNNLAAK